MIGTLALPLLFAVTVLMERFGRNGLRWLLAGAAAAVLYALWHAWPGWTSEIRTLRYLQLSLAFHTFVAFSPFARSSATNGFWQYNKALFLRFLTAGLYTSVLYIGLSIALKAVDTLLKIQVSGDTYFRLWCVLAFVFSTCFFVGGVPEDIEALEGRTEYPNGLRAFTQFVLVPLVAVYLAILMLYLGKVVITQEWPNGWIGYLVSSVAAVGILAWLLVHPLEERPEYRWVKPFTKGFYVALMPAIVMLWLAIWKRTHQYGITEPRYFLIVLSVWLAAVALYYTFSKSRNIKLIPASLCFLAVVTFAGPTGAYAVSQKSQFGRLQAVLVRDGLLAGGRLHRSDRPVSDTDAVVISAGIRYLLENHGYESIAGWLPDSLRRPFAARDDHSWRRNIGTDADARAVMAVINVPYSERYRSAAPGGGTYVYFVAGSLPPSTRIDGFDYAVTVNLSTGLDSVVVDGRTVLRFTPGDATLHLMRDGASLLDVPLQAAVDSARKTPRTVVNTRGTAPPLRIEARNEHASVLFNLTVVNGTEREGKLTMTSVTGEAFLKIP